MHYTLMMMMFGCLVAQTFTRPATMEDAGDSEFNSEGDEAEYAGENDGSEADDSVQDEEESRLSEQDSAPDDQEEEPRQNQHFREPNGNAYSQKSSGDEDQTTGDTGDSFAGLKSNKNSDSDEEPVEESNSNNEYQTPTKLRESGKFIEKGEINDQPDALQHLLNRDDNNVKSLRNDKNAINKRTPISRNVANEEDLLFESNDGNRDQREKTDKGEYNNESSDASEQSQYSKKLYNTMQEGVPDEKRYDNHYNLNRDRRAIQDTNDTISNLNSNNAQLETDDEEAAIKRHVKKLSGEELDELLNSLTEDKRELLKKIMENDAGSDNEINKREITKKASAAPDENGYLESGQSDTSKLQEGSPGSDSNAPAQSSTEHSKLPNPQSDINVLPVTKTLEVSNSSSSTIINTDNKAEFITRDPDSNSGKSESGVNTIAPVLDSNNQAKVNSNPQESTKTETKRETNMKDLSNFETPYEDTKPYEGNFKDSQDFARDSGYFYSQDEDLSRIMDDESQINNNINKREVLNDKDADFSDSMKSLEDSFPNSNSYDDDDPYSGSDMAPLVRVKRKNLDMNVKKRAAGILPDAKVAYFPYKAENDDEDNDEGNEFDDDGFYDRTANLAKSNIKEMPSEEETSDNLEGSAQQTSTNNKNCPLNLINRSKLASNNKMESDTMSLGSDTDSVLSGVEGVDDNLMFNSGTRNRRTAEASVNNQAAENTEVKLNRPMRSTPLMEDKLKSASETYINVPNYHENDAFGPLPRSYEGELGRYKRIRRVKQPSSSKDMASSSA
ncbi:putative uncharacterized protein DDB_G0282133 [Pectinophora gossypiella]|uniref:putative uncharacterized protein DDB_G0282133 n=1 Tax=Pectinophora gossypiella TaxID=13191 RepID=UPI00214E0D51|nr:putative uncharacterized protein DDB_G0282133 [Pectinophora gossypiella]